MSTYSRGPKPYFKGTLWGQNKGLFLGLLLKKSELRQFLLDFGVFGTKIIVLMSTF